MSSQSKTYLSPEDYLALERAAAAKSEYYHGEVYAMAGASRTHTLIAANAVSQLVLQLKGRSCTAHTSDLRVRVGTGALYTYPDVVVVCGKAVFEDRHQDTLLNPIVIVEVLSPSTEAYDRGAEFAFYRKLESLADYVLISQDQPLLEHYARQPGDSWLLTAYEGMEAVALLPSIGCELPLAEVYDKVEWPETAGEAPALTVLKEEAQEWQTQ